MPQIENDEDDENPEYIPDIKRVTPRCCEEVEKYQAVFLVMPDTWTDGDTTTPPKWCIKCVDPEHGFESVIEVRQCPFCGEHMPEIIRPLVKSDRPICACSDGGYYCDTCKQRLMCCSCLRPDKAWGPNAYDPKFGDDKICECGHPYYRHFDSYEQMRAVGCKYCDCHVFKEPDERK